MARKRAVVDQDITPHERLVDLVSDRIDASVGVGGTESAAIEDLADADVAFVTSRVPLTRRVMSETDLELISKIGTGVDTIDLEAARDLGIPVTHTPGINALSVAEHTLGLLLAVHNRVVEGHRTVEEGGWRDDMPAGSLVTGTVVGIVGFGDIGQRVASLLRGFDVETLAYDPYVESIAGELGHAELVDFETLLERSDSVLVHTELTDETRGMIDADAFDRMQEDAVLINAARGDVVDQEALIEALRNDEIAAAGLDVFATEPVPEGAPITELDDVTMTPHTAGVTSTARTRGLDTLAENTLKLLDGEPVNERFMAT